MSDSDIVDIGAVAIAGALFATMVFLWPGVVGPWFFGLAAMTNALAAVGLGWDTEEFSLISRLSHTNHLLLMPFSLPLSMVLGFVFLEEKGNEDGE